MFCSKCGTQLNDDAKFCKECGAKTAAGKAEAAAATATPATATPAAKPAPARAPRRTAAPAAFAEDNSGRSRIVLAVVGILGLAAVGFFLWKSGDSGTSKPVSPNIAASGEPVQKGIAEIDRVPSGLDISGTISLAPGITPPASGALYVMARPAATPDQRSPLAVDKVNPGPGTTNFVIGPDNLMTGGAFDQPVVLSVRWDQDGDPLTKQIGDLTGAAGPFKPGDTNAAIVLNQKLEKAELHPGLIDGTAPGAIAAADGLLVDGTEPEEGADSAPAEPADGAASAPAEGTPTPGADPTKITGKIVLGDGVKAPADGTIFVIARNPGVAVGPPVAAAKLTPGAQGLTYSIGPEDVMMGGPFKGPYDISARWDQDGNAMSKQPGDLSGAAKTAVSAGQSADIVLDTINQ